MNGLVGYDSSDEEGDVQPERPAKVAKIDTSVPPTSSSTRNGTAPSNAATIREASQSTPIPEAPRHEQPQGPAAGPHISAPPSIMTHQPTSDEPPLSPYTYERARLRELTMPATPNFEIPDSPPGPMSNSEEAAELAARTKKFQRFLDLKKQGVHFNARLHNSSSLRNPSLLPKLMDFAGIEEVDSYASTLPDAVSVPVKWREECYIEALMREGARQNKKQRAQRDKVEFVSASRSVGQSESVKPEMANGSRKNNFDQR